MAARKCCRRSTSGNSEKWDVSVKPEVAADRDDEMSLIMGIPDVITIYYVLTKLPWTSTFPISRLNSRLQRSVKSRQLYNARESIGCTQTFIPIIIQGPIYGDPVYYQWNHWTRQIHEESTHNGAISVYDPVMDRWHILPPVPSLLVGILEGCGCVSFNGKIYVLGGWHSSPRENLLDTTNSDDYDKGSRKDVFSPDLTAGDTTWTKCAEMNCGRAWFNCGINDGNIYVFWGVNGWGGRTNFETAVVDVEVYDPDENLWDIVAPVPWRDVVKYSTVDKFATVGETFVIHSFFHSRDPRRNISLEHTYDTGKDEWKIDEHFANERQNLPMLLCL